MEILRVCAGTLNCNYGNIESFFGNETINFYAYIYLLSASHETKSVSMKSDLMDSFTFATIQSNILYKGGWDQTHCQTFRLSDCQILSN
jgi:hypothetical protein